MLKTRRIFLAILFLIALLDGVTVGLVYPMFSSMMFHKELQFLAQEVSNATRGMWLGVLLSAGPLMMFLSSPIIGALSDQKGRKKILQTILLVLVVGYFFLTLAVWLEHIFLLLFGRLIVGVGAGSSAVVFAAAADISEGDQKAKNFALLNMAIGIGFTIGPFLGGKISGWGGFDKPFLFSAIVGILSLILVTLFFQETLKVRKKEPFNFMLGIKNLRKAFCIPRVGSLFIGFCIFCFGWSFYWEFIPVTWIEGYELTTSQVGDMYAYGAAFYALSCGVLIRPLVSRFRALPICFLSLLALGGSIFLLLFHTKVEVFWGYIPVQQFLLALIFPIIVTLISNSVPEDMQGEVMGITQSMEAFAFAVSPLLAGAFLGISYTMPIVLGALSMLLAALVLFLGFRGRIFSS